MNIEKLKTSVRVWLAQALARLYVVTHLTKHYYVYTLDSDGEIIFVSVAKGSMVEGTFNTIKVFYCTTDALEAQQKLNHFFTQSEKLRTLEREPSSRKHFSVDHLI